MARRAMRAIESVDTVPIIKTKCSKPEEQKKKDVFNDSILFLMCVYIEIISKVSYIGVDAV